MKTYPSNERVETELFIIKDNAKYDGANEYRYMLNRIFDFVSDNGAGFDNELISLIKDLEEVTDILESERSY